MEILSDSMITTGVAKILPREQRLHFHGMSWRAKSYFSHASSYSENVASARRVQRYWLSDLFPLV